MSKFAVVQLAGKQFKVSEGDTILVDAHLGETGTLTVNDVLLTSDGKTTQVGTPVVAKASVDFTVVEETRGPKIDVRTYKSKSKYRKHIGHRQDQTVLKVAKITA